MTTLTGFLSEEMYGRFGGPKEVAVKTWWP